MQIAGSKILITGASQGIGSELARLAASRGAQVALIARNHERLRGLGIPNALLLPGDLSDPEFRRHAADEAQRVLGGVDILVNNAGVGVYSPSWNSDFDQVRYMFEVNLFAAIDLTQRVTPAMRAARHGMIVNVSSLAGQVTLPWFTLYSATKHAMTAFTEGLRMELEADGVWAMAVHPGYVKTGFQDHVLGGNPPPAIRKAKAFAVTPAECAASILRGIERRQRTVSSPAVGDLFVWARRIVPRIFELQLARYNRGLAGQ